jgi:hypothetical protein
VSAGPRFLGRLATALAFAAFVVVGVVAGGVLSVTESLDEQLASRKRPGARPPGDS